MTDKDKLKRNLSIENNWEALQSALTWLLILSILFVSIADARLPCICVQQTIQKKS